MTENTPQLELKRFALDNLIVLFRIILSSLISIAFTIVLARGLGNEGKGIYELSIYVPNLLANVIFNFGMPLSIAYYIARGDFSLDAAISGTNFLNIVLTVIAIVFGIGLIYFEGASWFGTVPPFLLYASLALIPMMMVLRNGSAIFRGMQDFRIMGLLDSFQPIVSLIVIGFILLSFGLDVSLALIAVGIGYILATVLVLILLWRRVEHKKSLLPRFNYAYIKSTFIYGLQVYGAIIMGNLLLRADIFLLNIWGQGVASVGIYSVAVSLVERVWTLSSFNNAVLMPRIASWKDDNERQGQLTLLSVKYSFWLGILIAVALLILGKPFLLLSFGRAFEGSFAAILSLLPGVIFYNLARPIGSALVGRGDSKRASFYAFVALLINVLANFILIPLYDFVGAGIASSIAYTVYGMMMLWDFSRSYEIPLYAIFAINSDDRRRFTSLVKVVKTWFQRTRR